MLAYTTEKSYLGQLGFDSLNFFTNDLIRFTGFEPSEFEIELIGRFVQKLNESFFSTEPIQLMISKIDGVFVTDVKIFNGLKAKTASGEAATLGLVFNEIERKVFM